MAKKYVKSIKFSQSGETYYIRDAEAKDRLDTLEPSVQNLETTVAGKQDKLTAGANITIENNVISATGGGTGAVESVNGKTGVVNLSASDVHAATEAQGALADTAVQPAAIADMATKTELSAKQDKLTSANQGANIVITEDAGVVKISATGSLSTVNWGGIEGTLSNQADLQNALNAKQDTIADLSTIRSDAEAGKNASNTIATYGDVVSHNASDFATSAQGAKADSAVQPAAIEDMETKTHAGETYAAKSLETTVSTHTGNNDIHVTASDKSTWSAKQDALPDTTGKDGKYLKVSSGNLIWAEAGGGSGGTSDYSDLDNKPMIENHELAAGNNTAADLGLATSSELSGKQDTINDLADIRSGAAAGATALQSGDLKTINDTSLVGSGNIDCLTSSDVGTMALESKDDYYTKTAADAEFLTSNQGSENDGKVLKVNSDGTVSPATVAGSTVDSEISATSENPVQNKVIKSALDNVVDYIPNGGIAREKLSFQTKPLKSVGTQSSISCANSVAELYFDPNITLPSETDYWIVKAYNRSFYCRPSSSKFSAYISLSSKENYKCYTITISTTTDAENYPVGTLVAYVVFNDIETLKTLSDTSSPKSVNYDFCTNLTNNPVIAGYIQFTTGLPDNVITTSKIVNKAVTYEKIDFATLRPLKSASSVDYSGCVAEFYPNPDIVLPTTDLCIKCFGSTCYYRPSNQVFRATCKPTENYKVYELKIDVTTDETLYPKNKIAGYIVFDNVAEFLSKEDGGTPIDVNYEYCKNLAYSPRINNHLNAQPTPDAPVTIETYNEDRNVEICLPATLYAVVGDTIQLFHRSILRCFNPYIYSITVICNIGNNYPRYYELTPTEDQIGDHSFTYIVRDQNCKTLSTKTINLKVVDKGVSPTNNMNVLCIGASATSAGLWPSELKRRLISSTGTPEGDGLSNITFVGRMTATPNDTGQQINYEATGGYTFGSYVSTNDYLCKFFFETEHLPNYVLPGDVYSYSGVEYTITEINIPSSEGGYAGYISGRPNGNGTQSTSGILTKVSGTGDATITFDQSSRGGNPFCYDGVVDLQRYANEFCNGTIDLVYSQLVFNGAIINGTVEQIKAGANIANMITFANYLHTAFPNAKLGLGTGYNPDTKGGCGANYGASNSTEYGYKFYVMNLARAFQEAIDENNLGDFVFVATNTPEVDSENIFPSVTKPVNTRSTVTEARGSNGVHPTSVGQFQVADSYYRDFIARFCQSES